MKKDTSNHFIDIAVDWCVRNDNYSLSRKIMAATIFSQKTDNPLEQEKEDYSEIFFEFARELWIKRDLQEIEKLVSITAQSELITEFEENGWDLPDMNRLNQLGKEFSEEADENRKRFIWALGFSELYYYETTIELCEEILDNIPVNSELAIEIRLTLNDLFDYCDVDSAKALNNCKILSEILMDPEEKEKIVKQILLMSSHDVSFLCEFLKKNDDTKWWALISNGYLLFGEDLVDLYEKVSPRCVLPEKVYSELAKTYQLENKFDKADAILNRFKHDYPDEFEEGAYEVKSLISKELFEDALSLIEKKGESEKYHVYKGRILCGLKKYEESLAAFMKCGNPNIHESLQWMVIDYLELGKSEDAKKLCLEFYKKEASFILYLQTWIRSCSLGKDFLVELLSIIEGNPEAQKYSLLDEEKIYNYIFYITEPLKGNEKGQVRFDLLRVYECVCYIRNILRLDILSNKSVYHYSKEKSLKYLPAYSNKYGGSPFRMGNVAYLNDPEEGKVFGRIVGQEEDPLDDLKYRNAYLASFCLKADSLPMWVQYADDARGCCYEIDTTPFPYFGKDNLENHIINSYFGKNDKNNSKGHSIYKVYYYDETQEDDDVIRCCKWLWEHVESLRPWRNKKKIDIIINELLDSIRYLFKDSSYKTEEEVRVIQIDYDNKRKIDISDEGVPKFYIELETPLYFNSIMFGPKATNVKTKAAYLRCCRNVGEVSKSKIKYV